MAIVTATTWVVLGILVLFFVGGIFLQLFLSKRESRWPGLVLPALTFVNSLVYMLSVAAIGSAARTILTMLAVLLAGNIPTLVLLAIYWAAREKLRKKSELEKMKIDDL